MEPKRTIDRFSKQHIKTLLFFVAAFLDFSCSVNHQKNNLAITFYENDKLCQSAGSRENILFLQSLVANIKTSNPNNCISVDYPFQGSIFPPEIVAPTFLWHDNLADTAMWMVAIRFDSSSKSIYLSTPGNHAAVIAPDTECIRDNNKWEESAYQKSAHSWTPDSGLWSTIKRNSVKGIAHIDIYGLSQDANLRRLVSRGSVAIQTSKDPVGAPIFYRDVPLMPARNPSGVIQPLSQDAVPLIAWRLRDIAQAEAPVVMKHMPTCINCHSFSAEGKTLGMDMDGPQGDKGAYALVPTAKQIMIQQSDVFTWNKFNPEKNTFGLFSRVSPDGKFVASAVDEEVHVVNYLDFKFLQTFYPTRAKIAIYDRHLKKFYTLPGANDSLYVQCNPVWSPNGQWIAFLRAKACAAFNGPRAAFANDKNETQIKYDLYKIPFNNGNGGVAQPVKGAFGTGKSVSFPKYSPDGKWIVFVQAQNGLLMRPDSRLYIIPADGGKAREMECNLPIMNSWHSWSPNSRWLVFSSKSFTPFTEMFLTHIDDSGNSSPAILIPNSTAPNRAVNIPEFVSINPNGISSILTPAVDYKIHFDKGKNFLNNEKTDSAYLEIMKAIALKPDYADNYSTLAFILAKQGKVKEAMEASLKAVDHDPSSDWVHANAGMLLYALNNFSEAIKHFEIANKLNPNSAITHYYLGLSLEAQNKPLEALPHYNEALRYDTAYTDAYNNRGTLYYKIKQVDKAIEDFSKAIAITPKVEFFHNRSIAYSSTGKTDLALVDINTATAMDTNDGMTWFIKGNTLLQMHHTDQALQEFEKALTCGKVYIQALEPFCDILFSSNRHAEAIPRLSAMLERDPENALFVNKRATAYMYTGDMVKALTDLDFVVSKAPGESGAYFNKALCFEKLGDLTSAIKNYGLTMQYGSPTSEQFAFAKKRIGELQRH